MAINRSQFRRSAIQDSYSLSSTDLWAIYAQGMDTVDVGYHTNLRLWGVFSDVILNDSNLSNDRRDSHFNQFARTGQRYGAFTAMEWALGLAFVVPFLIGVGVQHYKIKHARWLNSYQRLLEHVDQIDGETKQRTQAEEQKAFDELMDTMDSLIAREKVQYAPPKATTKMIPQSPIEQEVAAIDNSLLGKVAGFFWNHLSNLALVFWLVWGVAFVMVGITAAQFTFILPIVLTTLGLYLGVSSAVKLYQHYRNRNTQDIPKSPDDVAKAVADSRAKSRMSKELISRTFIKKEHAAFKDSLRKLLGKNAGELTLFKKKDNDVKMQPSHLAVIDKEGMVRVVEEQNPHVASTIKPSVMTAGKSQDAADSTLARFLMGSRNSQQAHLALKTINNLFGGYTLTFFIVWLLGSTALAFGLPGLGMLLLGNAMLSTGLSVAVGVLSAGKFFLGTKRTQAEYNEKILASLDQVISYRDLRTGEIQKATRLSVFKQYEAQLIELKSQLAKTQSQLGKNGEPLSIVEKHIKGYDLSKLDVYNTRYFDKQEYKAGWWTLTKQYLERAYKGLNAFQTFVFISRSLFLAGAVAAGVVTFFGAGWVPFIAIAATLGVVGMTLRLTQFSMDESAKIRETASENVDIRISWMKKKIKEVTALNELASNPIGPAVTVEADDEAVKTSLANDPSRSTMWNNKSAAVRSSNDTADIVDRISALALAPTAAR